MSLVIFDLDETMIHGDCSSLWSQRMASLGWVDESFVRRDAELMEQYAEGKLSMDLYMDYTLQPLIGRSVEEVEREVEAYVEEVIEPLIYSDACACLARHRSANDRVLIVSASGVHLVKPIAARIGVDEVLAIDLEVLDGHYSTWKAALLVVLPNLRKGVMVALLLSFSFLIGEFVFANLLVGTRYETLQVFLNNMRNSSGHYTSAVVVSYFVFVLVLTWAANRLNKDKA